MSAQGQLPVLTREHAEKFAALALAHVGREYPNKLDHVLLGPDDVQGPRALHPVFFGSFDWHSCVHGWWLLARVLRRFPDLSQRDAIQALFDERLTAEHVEAERAYAAHPARASFERPYGWAWLLALSTELHRHDTAGGARWAALLEPLAGVFRERFLAFLPKATYPIRAGTHFNTAFAVRLAYEHAEAVRDDALASALRHAAIRWYGEDRDCQAWEPSGDDFLSPAMMEAECMRRILDEGTFLRWFARFLPGLAHGSPASLFTPAHVSDRTDGKIAHLDGLNLSRAWCWHALALFPASSASDPWPDPFAIVVANRHLDASLPHVAGDYMGEHWLATFALLALDPEV